MVRLVTFLIFATALASVQGQAQMSQPDTDVPGVFQAGALPGQCFRDGYLAGRKHEDCGAILEGPVKIWLFRTVSGLEITLTPQTCSARPWKSNMKPSILVAKDAAAQIETRIAKGLKRLSSKCRAPQMSSHVSKADLQEFITLTDGLEF